MMLLSMPDDQIISILGKVRKQVGTGTASNCEFCIEKHRIGTWEYNSMRPSSEQIVVISTAIQYRCVRLAYCLWGRTTMGALVVTDHGHVMMMDAVVRLLRNL